MPYNIAGVRKAELLVDLFHNASVIKAAPGALAPNYDDVVFDAAAAEHALKATGGRIGFLFGRILNIDLSGDMVDTAEYNIANAAAADTFEGVADLYTAMHLSMVGAIPAPVPVPLPVPAKVAEERKERKDVVELEDKERKDVVEIGGDRKEINEIVDIKIIGEGVRLDYIRHHNTLRWLKNQGVIAKAESIFRLKSNNNVNITADEASITQLTADLYRMAIATLGEKGVNKKEISKEFLPSLLFSQLLGAIIPFEKDSLDREAPEGAPEIAPGDMPDLFPIGTKILSGPFQIKFPLLLKSDARKVHYHLMTQMKRLFGTPEELAKERLTPLTLDEVLNAKLVSWSEKLATLPELPVELQAEGAYDKFNTVYDTAGTFYLNHSRKKPGYTRVMCDDFENFMTYNVVEASKNPELAKQLTRLNDAFRTLQHAVVVNFSLLSEILGHEYGEKPTVTTGQPKKLFNQTVIPVEFDLPKLPYKNSDTILILDKSGSMEDDVELDHYGRTKKVTPGRLSVLQQRGGLEVALNALAQKPNQFLTVVAYSNKGEKAMIRQPLNPETLPTILKQIQDIKAGGGTNGLEGLKASWECISDDSNVNVILATDGAWDNGHKVYTPEDLPLLKKQIQELFKTKKYVPIRALGMDLKPGGIEEHTLSTVVGLGEEGSQKEFAPKADIAKKMNELILDKQFRFLGGITATFTVNGAPVATSKVKPFFTNEVTLRNIVVPEAVLKAAAAAKQEVIGVSLEIIFDDKSKVVINQDLSTVALAGATPASEFERKQFAEEWIDQSIYAFGCDRISQFKLLSGTEQFDLLTKIFVEACTLGIDEAVTSLTPRMEVCAKDWINDRIASLAKCSLSDVARKQPAEQLAIFERVLNDITEMGLKEAAEFINSTKINPIWSKVKLVEAAEVKSEMEFFRLSNIARLAALEKVKALADLSPAKKTISEDLTARITPLWIEIHLIELAGVENIQQFNDPVRVPVARRHAIFGQAKERAEKQGRTLAAEELGRMAHAIWVDARIHAVGGVDRQGLKLLVLKRQLEVLEIVNGEAAAIKHEEGIKELSSWMRDIQQVMIKAEFDALLCKITGIPDMKAFYELPMGGQLAALNILKEQQAKIDNPLLITELNRRILMTNEPVFQAMFEAWIVKELKKVLFERCNYEAVTKFNTSTDLLRFFRGDKIEVLTRIRKLAESISSVELLVELDKRIEALNKLPPYEQYRYSWAASSTTVSSSSSSSSSATSSSVGRDGPAPTALTHFDASSASGAGSRVGGRYRKREVETPESRALKEKAAALLKAQAEAVIAALGRDGGGAPAPLPAPPPPVVFGPGPGGTPPAKKEEPKKPDGAPAP